MLDTKQIDDISERLEDVIRQRIDLPWLIRRSVVDVHRFHSNIHLYLGERWVSENSLRVVSGRVDYDFEWPVRPDNDNSESPVINEVFQLHGDLKFYEYSGSLRYNLTTGSLMLFLKGGYGWSLYRIENVSTNGKPLPEPNGSWINMPTSRHPSTFLPNTGHFGAGIEWVPFRNSIGSPLFGIDISIRAEAFIYRAALADGFNMIYIDPVDPAIDPAIDPDQSGIWGRESSATPLSITQPVFSVAATLSF